MQSDEDIRDHNELYDLASLLSEARARSHSNDAAELYARMVEIFTFMHTVLDMPESLPDAREEWRRARQRIQERTMSSPPDSVALAQARRLPSG